MRRVSTFRSAILGGMIGLAIYACAKVARTLTFAERAAISWRDTHAAPR